MVETARLTAVVENKGVKKSTDELNTYTKSATKAEKSTDALTNSTKKSTPKFKAAKNAVNQLGFQVQDIAVQLQSGTSAMVVLGQQGSQVASIFGPGGAVLGAFIAIGAAVGGSLLPAIFDFGDGLEGLGKKASDLADNVDILTEAQRDFLSLTSTQAISELTESINDLRKEEEEIIERQNNWTASSGRNKRATDSVSVAQKELAERLIEVRAAIANGNVDIEKNIDLLDRLNGGTGRNVETISKLIKSLELERDSIGKTEKEIAIQTATLAGANTAEIARISTISDSIQAENDRVQAIKDSERAIEKRASVQARVDALTQRTQIDAVERINALEQRRLSNLELLRSEELESLIDFEEAKNEIIINAAMDRAAAEKKLDEIAAKEKQQALESSLGTISGLLTSENTKLFRIGQAAALAEIAISAPKGISKALEFGPIAGPILAVGMAAAFGAQAGAVLSASPPSARQQGGQFSAGQDLLVGERGPERVSFNDGGRIANASDTAGMNGKQQKINFVLIDQSSGGRKEAVEQENDDGRIVVLIRDTVSGDMNDPNSKISKSQRRNVRAERTL